VLAHKSRTKSPRNAKIGRKFAHPTGNNAHRFEVKRSKVKVTRPINAETESVSPTNFKLGRWWMHELSTAMASYESLWKVGLLHVGGAYRVGPTRRRLFNRPDSLCGITPSYKFDNRGIIIIIIIIIIIVFVVRLLYYELKCIHIKQ